MECFKLLPKAGGRGKVSYDAILYHVISWVRRLGGMGRGGLPVRVEGGGLGGGTQGGCLGMCNVGLGLRRGGRRWVKG